jgi:hypothetical protein
MFTIIGAIIALEENNTAAAIHAIHAAVWISISWYQTALRKE